MSIRVSRRGFAFGSKNDIGGIKNGGILLPGAPPPDRALKRLTRQPFSEQVHDYRLHLELVPKLTHKFKIDLFGCKITPK